MKGRFRFCSIIIILLYLAVELVIKMLPSTLAAQEFCQMQGKYFLPIEAISLSNWNKLIATLRIALVSRYFPLMLQINTIIFSLRCRCNVFAGPTVMQNEIIQIDCGAPRGLEGRYITVQQTER